MHQEKTKGNLPPSWKAPDFFTGMTIGASILIEGGIIMPSVEDITNALPRIAEEIIRRFNTCEYSLPGIPQGMIRFQAEFMD